MRNSTLPNEESIDSKLIEDIKKLQRLDLGAGAVICPISGDRICEGERVTAYAFCSESNPRYRIDVVCCREHEGECEWLWTQALRELIVRGRVGTVSDAATQSSWPVLLEPEPVAFSPEGAHEVFMMDKSDLDHGEGDDDAVVDVTRLAVIEASSELDQPSSWCDGGGPK